jgi:hypothetical protein
MFSFFKRLGSSGLGIGDLDYCSHKTFRSYVDKLCSKADSGWKRVTVPVTVDGFPDLQASPSHAGGRSPAATALMSCRAHCNHCGAVAPSSQQRPHEPPQIPPVELVYRDVLKMLRDFVNKFAKMEEYCWRWSFTAEQKTGGGEAVVEHPASAEWWREQAQIIEQMGGSLLALQLYSDDTTLNNKRSRSAYPLYAVPVNGSFELYKLLYPISVVAYMPVLKCPHKGAPVGGVADPVLCGPHPPPFQAEAPPFPSSHPNLQRSRILSGVRRPGAWPSSGLSPRATTTSCHRSATPASRGSTATARTV